MYQLPYGSTTVPVRLPAEATVQEITYRLEASADAASLLRQALAHPIGSEPLHRVAQGKRSAVILISDPSRLCPSYLLLPYLLEELNRGGLPDEAIRIVVALGAHRKLSAAELKTLTGPDVYKRVSVLNHSAQPEDCVYLGTSTRGTPFEINRHAATADLIVATGNIEPHRLVGISGGVKAIVPGVASLRCIEHNHALSQQFQVQPGHVDNPIHRDLEEVVPYLPPTFLLNVIVDHNRTVGGAVAGHLLEAHRVGLRQAVSSFLVPPAGPFDMVIASAGGHPKDMHLYQALKTLQNAASLTRPGGAIVLVASCAERFGNGIFQYWMETMPDRAMMVARLKEQFTLGAHKVEHLDKVLAQCTVYLYSDIPDAIVELTGLLPTHDLTETARACVASGLTRVAVLPYGALTFVREDG
ncbi:nickel-dependent lactate racemase [Paenibacillus sp. HJGM_3]|uniref:nickel-dependent lactate racemase n=1 Tax=Paenibacillus sp. HJGM_3 TaxID=3379816 RepID=UPI00385DD172